MISETYHQDYFIYVPGIQDDIYHAQSLAVKAWMLFNVRGHCHAMPWAGERAYEPKIQALRDEVDFYKAQGKRIFLIGASAGASAVLNLYTEDPSKIDGVALICPKINHPETVGQATYEANPAFRTALTVLQTNLAKLTAHDKDRMLICFSPKDGLVPYEDSIIPGVKLHSLPPVRHGYAIFYTVTLGSPKLCRQLKDLAA